MNAVLSANATGGDAYGWIDCCLQRWLLIWTADPPSHTRTFQWASTPLASISGPGMVVHDDTKQYYLTASDADGNLSYLQMYYSNIATPNNWFQTGGNISCVGSSCSTMANFTTSQVSESFGNFYLVVNAYNNNGLWCSGNITISNTDLWGNPLYIPQARNCGINNSALQVTILARTISGSVTEVDLIGCRWPHTAGTYTGISYQWGSNLQTPGTPWRNAFEAGISDWNAAPTKLYYYYSSSGAVTIDTYYLDDGYAGKSPSSCNGSTTVGFQVLGNTFYNVATNNQRHAIATHELGHGQSVGHISNLVVAVMGNNPDGNVYYYPQQADNALINQVYP